jgi:DNA-directed RNA polymerase specialized sigma subunit
MVLSRGEKEKLVLDLYYNKGYTYRDIAKELKLINYSQKVKVAWK